MPPTAPSTAPWPSRFRGPSSPAARRPLRTYLLALILLALAPSIGAAAIAVWRAGSAFRETSTAQLLDTSRTLARAVESELEHNSAVLTALASAPAPWNGGADELQGWLDGISARLGGRIVAGSAFGEAGAGIDGLTGAGVPRDLVKRAAAVPGRTVISDLFTTAPGAAPDVAIAVAPGRGDTAGQVLSLIIPPDRLVRSLQQRDATPSGILVAVTDGTGRIVARSRDPERYIGSTVPDWNNLKAVGASHGSFRALTTEGAPVIFAFQQLQGTPGWVVVVGEPLKTFDARWQQPLVGLAIGSGIAILLALMAVTWLARLVLRPVQALAEHAKVVTADEHLDAPMTVPPSPIAEFEALRANIESAESSLRRRAEAERRIAGALAASERRYRALAEVGALVFWRRDSAGAIISVTGWSELTGQPEAAAIGTAWLESIHPADRAVADAVWGEARAMRAPLDVEFRIAAPDGQWRWVRERGVAIKHEDGSIDEWVGVLEDVDARRQAQARIAHMAHHDALTGLANRLLFKERIEAAVMRVSRGQPEAVLCIDLDRFKEVNDTLGHPAGDALLCAVTERIGALVREGDTVARLGGDEFAIAQTGVAQPVGASALAARLVEQLSQPYDLFGHQVVIGASVGVALINPGDDPDRVLKNADMALYRAKEEGRGRFCFFEPAIHARMQERRLMEVALRRATAEREFEVYYQPLMKASTRELVSFEALLRWNHPERGQIQPADFIPLAEEIGLIVPLGEWVLMQACAEAATWPEHLGVSVNISPVQLGHRGLSEAIGRALRESGLAPQRLELEITENALIEDIDAAMSTLLRLKALGVKITMDDFGTGCSSLGYLRSLPFDKIKIDSSFVASLGNEQESRAIIKAVTGLCGSLGIVTTAEGVETEAQLDFLRSEHCTEVQGFLFSEPRPASQLPALLLSLGAGSAQAASRLRLVRR